jgi:hypothetical protein
MANAVVASWTACINELQQLIDDTADAAEADAIQLCLLQRINKLKKQPSLPHAAWKRLVQDMQVNVC